MNTIVLRLKIDKNSSFLELQDSNREVILTSLEHKDVPFETLVDALQPERKLNTNPLYQIMFAWQNTRDASLELEGVNSEGVLIKFSLMTFHLICGKPMSVLKE